MPIHLNFRSSGPGIIDDKMIIEDRNSIPVPFLIGGDAFGRVTCCGIPTGGQRAVPPAMKNDRLQPIRQNEQ